MGATEGFGSDQPGPASSPVGPVGEPEGGRAADDTAVVSGLRGSLYDPPSGTGAAQPSPNPPEEAKAADIRPSGHPGGPPAPRPPGEPPSMGTDPDRRWPFYLIAALILLVLGGGGGILMALGGGQDRLLLDDAAETVDVTRIGGTTTNPRISPPTTSRLVGTTSTVWANDSLPRVGTTAGLAASPGSATTRPSGTRPTASSITTTPNYPVATSGFSGQTGYPPVPATSPVPAASPVPTTSPVITAPSVVTTPADVAPQVVGLVDWSVDEGTSFSGRGIFYDRSGDGPWTGTVNYGDGSGEKPLALFADNSFQLTHAYADNNPLPSNDDYVITIKVTDRFGKVGTYASKMKVRNVTPAVTPPGDSILDLGRLYRGEVSFADPGTKDGPWWATADFGDGGGNTGIGWVTPGSPFSLEHLYPVTDGEVSYGVTVSVFDKDGAVGQANSTVTVRPPGS
jgi:hypothetical protein